MDVATDDLGNYRAAMTWAIEAGRGELALELAVNLRNYFWNRVMWGEPVKWLVAALALVGDGNPLVVDGVAIALIDAWNVGDDEAITALKPRAERLLATSSGAARGTLSNALAALMTAQDAMAADRLYRDAHQALRKAGSERWIVPLQNRMMTAWIMNDPGTKDEILELVSIAESENLHVRSELIRTCFQMIEGEYQAVLDAAESFDAGDDWEEAMMLSFAAHSARALGRLDDALEFITPAHDVLKGDGRGAALELSAILLALGRTDEAIAENVAGIGSEPSIADRVHSTNFFAFVAEQRGDFETSAILSGFARRSGEAGSVRPPRFDRAVLAELQQRVESALGADRYEALLRRGAETSWEDLPLVHG
jgi:hypothetical protein